MAALTLTNRTSPDRPNVDIDQSKKTWTAPQHNIRPVLAQCGVQLVAGRLDCTTILDMCWPSVVQLVAGGRRRSVATCAAASDS